MATVFSPGPGITTKTTSTLHFYANASTGSDSYDGTSATYVSGLIGPKATISGVLALVPDDIGAIVVVHLSGTFNITSTIYFLRNIIDNNAKIIIDGGSDVTTIAGPFTATAGGNYTVTVAGSTWTADDYMGYWIKITEGTGVGQVYQIQKNTADTLTTCIKWGTNPQSGSVFSIVRPTTEITSISGSASVALGVSPPWANLVLQRIYLSGTKPSVWSYRGGLSVRGVISNSSNTSNFTFYKYGLGTLQTLFDADGSDPSAILSGFAAGLSILNVAAKVTAIGDSGFNALVTKGPVVFEGSNTNVMLGYGSRVTNQVKMNDCVSAHWENYNEFLSNNSSPVEVTSSGVGILIRNSNINVAGWSGGVDVSNCGSHGIEIIASNVHLRRYLTGSNNTGAGVYAHLGSTVTTQSGYYPALTGTIGDITTDGTTSAGSWSGVNSGTPIVDTNELTMIKRWP